MRLFDKLDGFLRALGNAGFALHAFLRPDDLGLVVLDLEDLARTCLSAVATAGTLCLVNLRVHLRPLLFPKGTALVSLLEFKYILI